jgi:hypothetical protein
MRELRSIWLGLGLLMALALSGHAVRAAESEEDVATARRLAEEGQTALSAKDYGTAADRFRRAEELHNAPTLLVGLARAYVGLGKFVRARESYNKVLHQPLPKDPPPAFTQALKDAKAEIGAVESKIAWVTIVVTGADKPVVKVDGDEVPVAALGAKRAVDPGDHTVSATAEGFSTDEKRFSSESGASADVALTLTALPSSKPVSAPAASSGDSGAGDTQRLVGFIGIGVGAAGLVVGAITGGLAVGKHSSLTDACPNGQCPASEQGDLDSYHTLGLVSTIGFIAGGVLAAAGLVVVLTAPSDSGEAAAPVASVSASLGPGSIAATVRF